MVEENDKDTFKNYGITVSIIEIFLMFINTLIEIGVLLPEDFVKTNCNIFEILRKSI